MLGLRAAVPGPLQARVLSALRPLLVTTFAYGVPSDAALDRLAAFGQLLEIGAGGGYWARCLQLRGARVTAFDRLAPAQQRRKAGHLLQHHPVFIGGPAEALAAVPDAATLLLVWPPGSATGHEAARRRARPLLQHGRPGAGTLHRPRPDLRRATTPPPSARRRSSPAWNGSSP